MEIVPLFAQEDAAILKKNNSVSKANNLVYGISMKTYASDQHPKL